MFDQFPDGDDDYKAILMAALDALLIVALVAVFVLALGEIGVMAP
jgi:hypothetical protein